MSAIVRKVTSNKKREYVEKAPNKFDYIAELEELQALSDYYDRRLDFSRYNTLEEHMRLLDESNALRTHLRNNHKLAAVVAVATVVMVMITGTVQMVSASNGNDNLGSTFSNHAKGGIGLDEIMSEDAKDGELQDTVAGGCGINQFLTEHGAHSVC